MIHYKRINESFHHLKYNNERLFIILFRSLRRFSGVTRTYIWLQWKWEWQEINAQWWIASSNHGCKCSQSHWNPILKLYQYHEYKQHYLMTKFLVKMSSVISFGKKPIHFSIESNKVIQTLKETYQLLNESV